MNRIGHTEEASTLSAQRGRESAATGQLHARPRMPQDLAFPVPHWSCRTPCPSQWHPLSQWQPTTVSRNAQAGRLVLIASRGFGRGTARQEAAPETQSRASVLRVGEPPATPCPSQTRHPIEDGQTPSAPIQYQSSEARPRWQGPVGGHAAAHTAPRTYIYTHTHRESTTDRLQHGRGDDKDGAEVDALPEGFARAGGRILLVGAKPHCACQARRSAGSCLGKARMQRQHLWLLGTGGLGGLAGERRLRGRVRHRRVRNRLSCWRSI